MSIVAKLFGRSRPRDRLLPLYHAVVAEARQPHWYREGQVPDTVDGRFDMVAAVLSLVLIRMEREGDAARSEQALLTELFVDDMDGQLREQGVGDVVVGKHVGRMMGALGGRLTVYRAGLADAAALRGAVRRNLYREAAVSDEAVTHSVEGLQALSARLVALPLDALLAGRMA
ncbi:ubiquinol-cytochrome C chaperone family protein [Sphingomonas naphthae]|uniref:Ubiquinol-cytochrome C chaperone family protein n=1 Tax=Sphingomonas naphthae TaxID=1813468 RepID=A0ABY7TIU6_9SPHN|nr:ubiquinol-cytochrome C chaperone family protein [Sphingomonas naphthae]WCT73143.1 ubiquinol-cytochrome C chaperone family protein [Sphingomonas naphthae]